MGSNDQETGKIEAGDPLASAARREVRAKRRQKPDDGFLELARNLGRACWQAAADDDAGLLGGTL